MSIKLINKGQRTIIYGVNHEIDKLVPEAGANFEDEDLAKKLLRLFPGEIVDADAVTKQFVNVTNKVAAVSDSAEFVPVSPEEYKTMTPAEIKEQIVGMGFEVPKDAKKKGELIETATTAYNEFVASSKEEHEETEE